MPRNSSGACSLAESPFVANTPISSTAVNSDLSDIADMLTDSLSRTGQGGMSALLGLSLSGFAYTSDPDTGMSRSAANTQVVTCGGEDWTFTPTDLTTPSGTSLLPLIGEIKMWAFAAAPTGWVLLRGQACTTSYPLWRAALIAAGNPYGTSGGDPLFPDFRGLVPAGVDAGRGFLTGGTLAATIGAQTMTLTTPNLPAYTPSGTVSKPPITITNGGASATSGLVSASAPPTTGATLGAPIGASLDSAPTFTGTAQGGTSTAFGLVQPTLVINFIGRAA